MGPHQTTEGMEVRLGQAHRGASGVIVRISVDAIASRRAHPDIERRLLELGFVEGANVTIIHEGAFGRDPIAVRVENTTVALRRREAMGIIVRFPEPA